MFLTEIWRGPSLSLNSDTQAPWLGAGGAGSGTLRAASSGFLGDRQETEEAEVGNTAEDVGAKGRCSRRLGGGGPGTNPGLPLLKI